MSDGSKKPDGYSKANDPELIKNRIFACADQAQMNSRAHGGDTAIALMDLACALCLIAKVGAGNNESRAIERTLRHASEVVDQIFAEELAAEKAKQETKH